MDEGKAALGALGRTWLVLAAALTATLLAAPGFRFPYL